MLVPRRANTGCPTDRGQHILHNRCQPHTGIPKPRRNGMPPSQTHCSLLTCSCDDRASICLRCLVAALLYMTFKVHLLMCYSGHLSSEISPRRTTPAHVCAGACCCSTRHSTSSRTRSSTSCCGTCCRASRCTRRSASGGASGRHCSRGRRCGPWSGPDGGCRGASVYSPRRLPIPPDHKCTCRYAFVHGSSLSSHACIHVCRRTRARNVLSAHCRPLCLAQDLFEAGL